jgi:hypothetical protein
MRGRSKTFVGVWIRVTSSCNGIEVMKTLKIATVLPEAAERQYPSNLMLKGRGEVGSY